MSYPIFDDSDEGAPAVQFVLRPSFIARRQGGDAYSGVMGNYRKIEACLCPYPPGSDLRAAWVNGWEQAAERRRERERDILNDLLG